MKDLNDNFKIFSSITYLSSSDIKQFESYSKNYTTIIELDRYYDSSEDIYKDVNKIIEN